MQSAIKGGVGVLVVMLIWAALILHRHGNAVSEANNPIAFWRGDGTASVLATGTSLLSATPPDPQSAADLARQALVKSPLNTVALSLLGEAEDKLGQAAAAAQVFRLAFAANKHLRAPLIWAFNDAAQRNDIPNALYYSDLILRTAGPSNAPPEITDLMVKVAGDETAAGLLLPYIERQPTWLNAFLTSLANQGAIGSFERMVANIDYRPIAWQWGRYLTRMISANQAGAAYALNYALLQDPANTSTALPFLFDGGFERGAPDNLPFAWTALAPKTTVIQYDDKVKHSGNYSLGLAFSAPVSFRGVNQALLLPAGTYQLTGYVKTEDFKAARGLQWTVYCKSTQTYASSVIGSSDLFNSDEDWTEFKVSFVVPPAACDAQQISLETGDRIPAERAIEGRVWFDDLAITSGQSS